MASYVLVGQRTSSGSGTLSMAATNGGKTSYPLYWGATANPSFQYYFASNALSVIGVLITVTGQMAPDPTNGYQSAYIWTVGWAGQTSGGSGASASTSSVLGVSSTETYSWSFTADVYALIDNANGDVSIGLPAFDTVASDGHLQTPHRQALFYEVPHPGGTYSVSCAGASVSGTIGSTIWIPGNTLEPGCTLNSGILTTTAPSGNPAASASVTAVINGAVIEGAASGTYSYPGGGVAGGGSASYSTASGASISGTNQFVESLYALEAYINQASVQICALPPDSYAIDCNFVYPDGTAYPTPVTATAGAGLFSPSFHPSAATLQTQNFTAPGTFTFTNQNYCSTLSPNGNSPTPYPGITAPGGGSVLETLVNGVGCSVGILAANNPGLADYIDGRCLARLAKYHALTVTCPLSDVLDPCSSNAGYPNGWYYPSLAGVAMSSGVIHVDTSISPIVYRGISSPFWVMEGARYLQIALRSNGAANQSVQVQITQGTTQFKTWTIVTGAAGSYVNAQIDLCFPASVTNPTQSGTNGAYSGIDYQDSKYPVSGNAGGFEYNPQSNEWGPYWGVSYAIELTLTFPNSSGTYDISSVEILRSLQPKFTLLESNQPIDSLGNPGPFLYRYMTGETDEFKRSLEIFGGAAGSALSNASSYPQLADAIYQATQNGMWTLAAPGTDSAQWYYSTVFSDAGGGGSIYDGTPGDTIIYTDVLCPDSGGVPQTVNVYGQQRIDGVYSVPNAGGILLGSISAGPTSFRIHKEIGARFTGAALNSSGSELALLPIRANRQSDGSLGGSATTDANGYYMTATQFAKGIAGSEPTYVISSPSATGTASTPVATRHTYRLWVGLTPTSSTGPWVAEDAFGRYHLASVTSGKDVLYQRSDQSTYHGVWGANGTVTNWGDVHSVSMEIDHSTGRIHMLVVRNPGAGIYNVWLLTSDDDGASFTNQGEYMASALGASVWTDTWGGVGYCWFVYNSGSSGPGTMQGQYRPPGAVSFGATFTFEDTGGSNIPVNDQGWCNVAEAHDHQGRLVWSPIRNGSTTPTNYYSLDNGKTWTPS